MSQERLNILLIEHDPGFTRTMGDMIGQARDLSADLSAASGLQEGFSAINNKHFDVVVIEVALPDGAGLANISLLKAEAPRLPIIAAGDADNETVAVEAVQAGAQDYLVKGQLTPGWLERSIRYAIERHRMDVTLLAAEEKYHSIFDHLVEGIFQTTPEGRYLLANAALARIYGYNSPQELMESVTDIGRRLYVEEGRRDEFVRFMREHDTITGFESRIYRKDGTVIWISENCHARRNNRGDLLYYEGTVEDITQKKQTEENLRNSEALYHSLVETIPQNIFRKDTQGKFTFANSQFCTLLGVKLEDIVGKTDFDFFPAEMAEKYRRDDWRILETGQPFTTIEEHQSPKGERFFVQIVKTPLYEASGRIIGLQGMFWDITKQRQMEENLRNSEALYHSLVETIPQNIFRKDLHGHYTFVNRQFCKTLGKSREEVLGKTIADFLPVDIAANREGDDRKVIETKKPFEAIEESKFAGERGYIQVVKMPIFDSAGEVIGVQGMFWDITAQKMAAERIRKANTELARSRKELHAKNLELEDDLKMAKEIQITMLPQQYPSFPRYASPEESAFRFTHRYLPAGTVGGDFFTVSALSDEEASVFICDVAGHGVRSSLVTAMIRALLEELKPLAHDPGQFFTKLNRDLHAILKHAGTPMLTTGFYLVADWKTGIMRYTNAGHPKPLLVRRGKNAVEPLANIGGKSQPALGLFEEAIYKTTEVKIFPHDLVMLFTDGLYEVQDDAHELYSQSMLVTDVEKRAQLAASELFDQLIDRMQRFSADGKFSDDVCLVAIEATETKHSS
ncbi:MAG TPA: PAS domain S-box protein [Candidatus Polarisedimenticolia bacterium]|nr:PAS domain S-box protein [Candidatus Polarisedimenticolia bacterium]